MVKIQDLGTGNKVLGDLSACKDLTILFKGNNNIIEVGAGCSISGDLQFPKNNCKLSLGGRNRGRFRLYFKGDQGEMTVGLGTKVNGFLFVNLAEDDCAVSIGKNCLFSGVKMRPSDSHKIIDRETGKRINPPEPIIVEDHVWVGDDCVILGGARIGRGSVIGVRSMVNGELPAHCVAVGIPARPVKENIEWVE